MILTKLTGGLGNQLFQYAIGLMLSKLNNTQLLFDKRAFLRATPDRQFALGCFTLIDNINQLDMSWLKNNEFTNLKESYFHYNPDTLKKYPTHIRLVGYWQSEKYFKSISTELREGLKWKLPIQGYYKFIHSKIENSSNSVALHVRRGDYVSDTSSTSIHYSLPLSYYQNALQLIRKRVTGFTIFIFSDDIEWCKNKIKHEGEIIFVSNESENNPSEEFRLMSMCDHQIIANSTFSWWAAWLNTNSEKMVVSPKKWFKNQALNTKDLIPDSWHKIEVEHQKQNLESLLI